MRYGLLGETLKHSFSKTIHESISPITYDMIEVAKDHFDEFMEKKDFTAINVTIPYKEKVIPYLDEIDQKAKEIGAVNVIVNTNGKLKGYNTDYYGVIFNLKAAHIEISNMTVAILGSGGTSKTCTCVAKDLGAKEIIHVSRHKSETSIDYEELYAMSEKIDVIINTTPLGMYPNVDAQAVDISRFKNLSGVFDVVFNPLQTKLVQDAKKHGITASGGLFMLVAQGIKANELFLDTTYDDALYMKTYKLLLDDIANVALIGMPTSGKSTLGKLLAEELGYRYIDLDEELVKREGRTINEIFESEGEEYFRNKESELVKEYSLTKHYVISCGGGVIKREENMTYLHLNSKVIFINRDLDNLSSEDDRPLANDLSKLRKLYTERLPLYKKYSDKEISNNTSIEDALEALKEALRS